MVKKLINLMAAGIILFSGINVYAGDIKHDNSKLSVVDQYNPKNYRKNKIEPCIASCENEDGNFYCFHDHYFSSDGDDYPNIMESFPADMEGNRLTQEPLFYSFDKDKDGNLDEIYIDEEIDGWNGNEEILDDYIKRKVGI